MTKEFDYDVIIVGSGFGGSVAAARFSQAGKRVLVLERGQRWTPETFPRGPGDNWFYDVDEPHKQNGWLDMRWFGDMSVAMGAGVGGGSLIYGNVSITPPKSTFDTHWPSAINYHDLLPYFKTVGDVLGLQTVPDHQIPVRYKAAKLGAEKLGLADRFQKVPLAVSFDEKWTYDQKDPHADDKSTKFINIHGREQGTCNHCGFCCVGCPVKAKNTLDLNYLAIAEDNGAEIRPLHFVDTVEPQGEGYRVNFRNVESGKSKEGSLSAKQVVLAAGSLGSTEILLRSRDETKKLPYISKALGQGWSSNGDFLTFSTHEEETNLTRGPTISCAIDLLDGKHENARIFIEDGALGDLPVAYMTEAIKSAKRWFNWGWYVSFLTRLLGRVKGKSSVNNLIAWFAQSVDASNGKLDLQRPWYAPWRKRLHLSWDIKPSEHVFEAVRKVHTDLAKANNAKSIKVPATWTILRDLVTPHPLGGCRMADTPEHGVVDHRCEVFGYPNLFVADGAVIPYALGINPSRTIAAISERMCDLVLHTQAVSLKQAPEKTSVPEELVTE